MHKSTKYKNIEKLGSGGNGDVYLVSYNGSIFAKKTLKDFSKTNKYQRFVDEIKALTALSQIDNVVRIVDHYLPEKLRKQDVPFYIMPVGVPFVDYMSGKSHDVVIKAFLKIVKAVSNLHELNFTHRDIKPDNLLYINDEPVLSDFGLVDFPNKQHKSNQDENIGAKWTIAPEMQRTSSTAEFKAADVYSLAKTLWILLTGNKYSFEGQYIPRSNISLNNYVELKVNTMKMAGHWYYQSTVILDKLLNRATDNDPKKRPSADEFYEELNFWFKSNTDFFARNPYEWDDALNTIFPLGIPNKCEWDEIEKVYHVLDVLTKYDNLNYFFYPTRGGDSMKKVIYKDQKNFIINDTELMHVDKLIFTYLRSKEIGYFRLVIKNSDPITNKIYDNTEEFYVDENYNITEGVGKGYLVTRYLKGSFVFIHKSSKINELSGGKYNGISINGHSAIHNKISYDEYEKMLLNFL